MKRTQLWRKNLYQSFLATITIAALLLPSTALASDASTLDAGTPDVEILKGLYPGKAYSPYANRNFPNKIYWGDTHLHTGLSLDAGLFGNTLGPEDAYKLARGEQITTATG